MIFSFVKRLLVFILIVFIQAFVFNQINIMGYATPMVYIFFLLTFRKGSSRIALLLWGFLLGLVMDMFTNTPGIGASSCTLLAMNQQHLLNLFVPRDCPDDLEPSIKQQGMARFYSYILMSTFLYYIFFYLLLAFSLAHVQDLLINVTGGTLLSFILMIALNSLHVRS